LSTIPFLILYWSRRELLPLLFQASSAERKLGLHLAAAGFGEIGLSARYECYEAPEWIAQYLALQLERSGDTISAQTWRDWHREPGAMFAQAWVAAVAKKPA